MYLIQSEKAFKKREKRLEIKKKRLEGKHCHSCKVALSEVMESGIYSKVSCPQCIRSGDARRARWMQYYARNKDTLLPKMRRKTKLWKYRKATQPTKSTITISNDRIRELQELSLS